MPTKVVLLKRMILAATVCLASCASIGVADQPALKSRSQIEKIQHEAKGGSGEASYELYYYFARRSPRKEAMRWLRLSAEQKFPKAYYALAVELFFSEGKASEAKPWAEKAVKARVKYANGVLEAINAEIEKDRNSEGRR